MFTEYVDPSKPLDFCEHASRQLLAPATVAFGRWIDVQTGLVHPRRHIIIRVASAAVAILFLPVTLLGVALRFMSVTHWQHSGAVGRSFKPIVLVVSKDQKGDKLPKQLLDETIKACRDVGQSEPLVVEWDSGKGEFLPQSESEGDLVAVLNGAEPFSKHTAILLSSCYTGHRVFNGLSHDGWFGAISYKLDPAHSRIFAITQQCSNDYNSLYAILRGQFSRDWDYNNDFRCCHTYNITSYNAAAHAVMEVLKRDRAPVAS